MLKREIETLKSEEQMMYDEATTYLKKIRQCELADLKNRYELIRMQKAMPDMRRIELSYGDSKVTLEIKSIL